MAEANERVAGGTLPDWEVADLPAPPPYQFGKAFRNILGPRYYCLRRFNRQWRVVARGPPLPRSTAAGCSGLQQLPSYFRSY